MPRKSPDNLTERDICTKFITPALVGAGWDLHAQIREEVAFTAGRINIYGKTITRGEKKRADYILYYKNNFPIALIEAKDANHFVGDGIQQALSYAESLDIPFVYSSNGKGFLEHDRLTTSGQKEREFLLSNFPSPEALYQRYKEEKGLVPAVEEAVLQDYYENPSAHPRVSSPRTSCR